MKKEDSNKLKTQNLQNISDEIALSLFLESIMATKQTTYKELPEDISEKLKNLPDELLVPLLFNFILGPAQEMKDTIDKSDETIKDAVVAVYGATVMPLKKRMAALKKISVHVNLDNGVILSGGRSWTSIVPKSYRDQIISNYEINEDYRREIDYKIIRKLYRGEVVTYDETTQEIIEEQIPKELIDRAIDSVTKKIVRGEEVTYDETTQEIVNKVFKEVINDEVRKKINEAMKFDNKKKQIMRDRAKAIIEKVPKIRDFLHDRNKSLWEDLLAEEKKKIFEKGVNESSSESLLKFSTYDQMYKNYIEQKINEIINSNVSRQEYYKIYEEQKISGQEFDKWLYDYLDNQYIIDQIIHTLTEVDIMKIELEGLEWEEKSKVKKDELRIIEDKKATHTRDNAENIIIEFLKLRESNQNLKKIIVISDWQYLLRQVLTTQKVAQDMGITDVEIIGYPADILEKYNNQVIALKPEDIEEFKWVMLTELDKIVRYKDVGDMNIPNNSGQLKDEPIVLVKKENATLQELLQNLKKTNPQEGHQSNPQTSTLGEK